MKLDVILNPAEIDHLPERDLTGSVCVVFDVLRATSSMITGLAHGTGEIQPVCTIEEALELKKQFPEAVLGGERFGDRIEGFDLGNSPLEYRKPFGRIITTTTNGTVALKACERADAVLVGALLNLGALTEHLRTLVPAELIIVCAGTFRLPALEDMLAAGRLCAEFPNAELSDAAICVQALHEKFRNDPLAGLLAARNGQTLIRAGREADVRWCAQLSVYDAVGRMDRAGIVRRI